MSNANLKLTFNPHPLIRNRHFQTIYSSLRKCDSPHLLAAAQEMILEAGDGIRLQGFYSPQPKGQSKGLVLLLHGWLGSVNSSYILSAGEYLFNRGYAVFRLNFRDHGGTHHLNPGFFRGDLLDEVVAATRRIAGLENSHPFYILGASLGGSFALRLAWRHAQNPIPNLRHTIAFNPAINPYHTTLALDNGPYFYLHYFRRKWREAFKNKQAAFPELYPDISAVVAAPNTMTMTEAFMPFSPYDTALDYLNSYAVTPEMMAQLTSPVTIITAADDPVVPVEDFEALHGVSDYLNLHIQTNGGHVGFVDIFPYRPWLCEVALHILEEG